MKESKGFNAATGTSSEGFSRGTNRFAGNQHATTNSDALINKGRGPTVGNKSDDDSTYPDAARIPKSGLGKDMFTGSAQVRTPGGTRAFEPSATQNYKGNADKMNVGRGPTKGNQR
jgi:hypothetical protein